MEEKNTFTVLSDTGEEVECELLFSYEVPGKTYIVYTDNKTDEEGNTRVYASVVSDVSQENPELEPIETDEEWSLIESILSSLMKSEPE